MLKADRLTDGLIRMVCQYNIQARGHYAAGFVRCQRACANDGAEECIYMHLLDMQVYSIADCSSPRSSYYCRRGRGVYSIS